VIVNLEKYHARFPGKTPGWATWAEFINDASALSEVDATGKPCLSGLDIDPDWPEPARHILLSQILQRGGSYWNATGDLFNFDTPEARASLASMVSWITVNKVMFPSLVPTINTFVTNRLVRGASGFGCTTDVTRPLSVIGYLGRPRHPRPAKIPRWRGTSSNRSRCPRTSCASGPPPPAPCPR
jgi:hypothetical protein